MWWILEEYYKSVTILKVYSHLWVKVYKILLGHGRVPWCKLKVELYHRSPKKPFIVISTMESKIPLELILIKEELTFTLLCARFAILCWDKWWSPLQFMFCCFLNLIPSCRMVGDQWFNVQHVGILSRVRLGVQVNLEFKQDGLSFRSLILQVGSLGVYIYV